MRDSWQACWSLVPKQFYLCPIKCMIKIFRGEGGVVDGNGGIAVKDA